MDSYIWQYVIIIGILLVVAVAIIKSKKRDFKFEANKLVELLGGIDNIKNYDFNKSRFVVDLKDVSKANKEGIQKMGAQGIVEIDNQLKIILGEDAKQIKKYIKELKWLFTFFLQNTTIFDKKLRYIIFGDSMNIFEMLILNMILISYPLLIYIIYIVANKNINKSEKDIFFDFILITSIFLAMRYGS